MRQPEQRNIVRTGDARENPELHTFIEAKFRNGFLPEQDPLTAFPPNSEFAVLDEVGRDLPSMLHDRGFRQYARTLKIPLWESRARFGAFSGAPRHAKLAAQAHISIISGRIVNGEGLAGGAR